MYFPIQIETLFQKSLRIALLLLNVFSSPTNWKIVWKVMVENELWECLIEEGQI